MEDARYERNEYGVSSEVLGEEVVPIEMATTLSRTRYTSTRHELIVNLHIC
jgi:hypothetical protein